MPGLKVITLNDEVKNLRTSEWIVRKAELPYQLNGGQL